VNAAACVRGWVPLSSPIYLFAFLICSLQRCCNTLVHAAPWRRLSPTHPWHICFSYHWTVLNSSYLNLRKMNDGSKRLIRRCFMGTVWRKANGVAGTADANMMYGVQVEEQRNNGIRRRGDRQRGGACSGSITCGCRGKKNRTCCAAINDRRAREANGVEAMALWVWWRACSLALGGTNGWRRGGRVAYLYGWTARWDVPGGIEHHPSTAGGSVLRRCSTSDIADNGVITLHLLLADDIHLFSIRLANIASPITEGRGTVRRTWRAVSFISRTCAYLTTFARFQRARTLPATASRRHGGDGS